MPLSKRQWDPNQGAPFPEQGIAKRHDVLRSRTSKGGVKMEDALQQSADFASVVETAFRAACGQFPTGVTIITALDASHQPIGLTANSFASVALSPPTVLWSVGPKSRSFESFIQSKFYAVHILHKTQKDPVSYTHLTLPTIYAV